MSTRTVAARAQIPWHWGAPPRASVPARTAELGPPITRTAVTRARPGVPDDVGRAIAPSTLLL